jgi:hypothetical protein
VTEERVELGWRDRAGGDLRGHDVVHERPLAAAGPADRDEDRRDGEDRVGEQDQDRERLPAERGGGVPDAVNQLWVYLGLVLSGLWFVVTGHRGPGRRAHGAAQQAHGRDRAHARQLPSRRGCAMSAITEGERERRQAAIEASG